MLASNHSNRKSKSKLCSNRISCFWPTRHFKAVSDCRQTDIPQAIMKTNRNCHCELSRCARVRNRSEKSWVYIERRRIDPNICLTWKQIFSLIRKLKRRRCNSRISTLESGINVHTRLSIFWKNLPGTSIFQTVYFD